MDKQITALMDEQTKNTLDKLAARLEDALAPLNGIDDLKTRLDAIEAKLDAILNDLQAIRNKE